LDYIEGNAQPVIEPSDAFLSSFAKEDTYQPVMDTISQTNLEEEQIEELHEVVEVDDEGANEQEQDTQEPLLDVLILPDREKRKMDKVQAQADKDAEKERKKAEKEALKMQKETLKAEREREKADKKLKALEAKLRASEIAVAVEA
jgi:hypothetical protein